MLSLLVRQHLFLGDQFEKRYPSSWLVWEPGPWRPARTTAEGDSKATMAADSLPARPAGSDALCFELRNNATRVTLGRSSESEIFINDLTLSREHLVLENQGGWSLTVAPSSSTATQFEGATLAPGTKKPLLPNARIKAGDVHLSFYNTAGMLARLREEATRGPR